MTVPWTGFPLAELVKLANPLGDATYLRMETFMMPDVATGQKQIWYPWPYVEGLTIAEATNELAFLVDRRLWQAGAAKSMGAPLRLHAALEVRLQVDQVDRPLHLHRRAAGQLLGAACRHRVRLLGQRQSRGAAPALEPGDGARHHHQRVDPDRASSTVMPSTSRGYTPSSPTSRSICKVRVGAFRRWRHGRYRRHFEQIKLIGTRSSRSNFEAYAASAFSSTITSVRPRARIPSLNRSILVPWSGSSIRDLGLGDTDARRQRDARQAGITKCPNEGSLCRDRRRRRNCHFATLTLGRLGNRTSLLQTKQQLETHAERAKRRVRSMTEAA